MTDDIVTRLRVWSTWLDERCPDTDVRNDLREAADEIERLRKEAFSLAANQCHAGYCGEYGHHRCREIDRLTAERDEARRLWCIDIGELYSSSPLSLAKERVWDCFKEATDGR